MKYFSVRVMWIFSRLLFITYTRAAGLYTHIRSTVEPNQDKHELCFFTKWKFFRIFFDFDKT